jgi:hypothetical protein
MTLASVVLMKEIAQLLEAKRQRIDHGQSLPRLLPTNLFVIFQ